MFGWHDDEVFWSNLIRMIVDNKRPRAFDDKPAKGAHVIGKLFSMASFTFFIHNVIAGVVFSIQIDIDAEFVLFLSFGKGVMECMHVLV